MPGRLTTVVSPFEVDPDLLEDLDPEQKAEACLRALAPMAILRAGEPDPWRCIDDRTAHLGLLVLDGLLARNMTLLDRTTTELLGAGDIIRPWDDATEDASVPHTVDWTVHLPTRVALLDHRFAERIAPWPAINGALLRRSVQRARWLGRHLAILENPRVDARLLLLFWQLADRWGTVGPDGVTVPFRLTHKTLGRLVRAQRPSVTAALHELSERGVLIRRKSDAGWILRGEAREELRLLLDGAESPLAPCR